MKRFYARLTRETKWAILWLLVAMVSVFVFARIFSSSSFSAPILQSLEEKKTIVMRLAGATATTGIGLSFIPSGMGAPIANQLLTFSSYFIVIIGAITLEKVLMSIVAFVTFYFILPVSCLMGVVYLYKKKEFWKTLAIRLAVFGIVLFIAIPVSITISNQIEYSFRDSIERTTKLMEQNAEQFEENEEELLGEERNFWGHIGVFFSDAYDSVVNGLSNMVKSIEDAISAVIDSIAILLITSCVIPIVVIFVFMWVIKILFGFDDRANFRRAKRHHNFRVAQNGVIVDRMRESVFMRKDKSTGQKDGDPENPHE